MNQNSKHQRLNHFGYKLIIIKVYLFIFGLNLCYKKKTPLKINNSTSRQTKITKLNIWKEKGHNFYLFKSWRRKNRQAKEPEDMFLQNKHLVSFVNSQEVNSASCCDTRYLRTEDVSLRSKASANDITKDIDIPQVLSFTYVIMFLPTRFSYQKKTWCCLVTCKNIWCVFISSSFFPLFFSSYKNIVQGKLFNSSKKIDEMVWKLPFFSVIK